MASNKGGIAQLAPVNTDNVHQRVYMQMRQAIMSGKFRPGETLTLRPLAAALGTSVIPARDAVLRLVTERALENHRRSVRVPLLALEELRDVERYRILLESEAAALAAARASDDDLLAIEQASARAEKAYRSNKIERFLVANQEFHFAVYAAAHSDLLQSIIEKLWLQVGPHLGALVDSMRESDLSEIVDLAHHQELVRALKARDADGARAALAADLEDSTDVYRPYRDGDVAVHG
ncbi:GntR family transcriptional regulator [Novosphingobium sp. Gsoil 351]|uniref:GntR family transcriptional regulator n=1 Tax=Novosphingobium sp. Gsoil 351 TaxID=2675225 RepID=UPI0018A85D8F|nr:GntR family transcriptional regulator [Novosphingobium sp. Gsoil 351]